MRAGLPADPAQWIAVALSLAAVFAAPGIAKPARRRFLFLFCAATAAALLSAFYIVLYLRGGPRIIDATSYWLEARALSEGYLSWPVDEPISATLGRFLVRHDAPDGPRLSVIFPPGYPAILALGFLAGAPLAVGPILATALVLVTYDLGEQVGSCLEAGASPFGGRADTRTAPISIGQIAAVLSVVCGALRYHTADTMSHGLAALCFASSITLAFRAARALPTRPRRAELLALAAGLPAGWLAATRPVSAIALAAGLALLFALDRSSPLVARSRLAAAIALASIPGLALLTAHQYAATGALGASSQALYYALSDGPEGCFRYGFGANIGCVGEHGDFLATYMPRGFGALEAAMTTLRRLQMHAVDALNAEPLSILVLAGLIFGRRSKRTIVLAACVLFLIAAYVPFYFDGNYRGGGARFFADALPFEHVLAAVASVAIARLVRSDRPAIVAGSVVALSLAGFALRAGFDHAHLRDREGGRPMFEPARLAEAGVDRGLVFVDTDHGFGIAFDPAATLSTSASTRVQIARFRGDAIDRILWEARGRPPSYRYLFRVPEGGALAAVAVEPLDFSGAPGAERGAPDAERGAPDAERGAPGAERGAPGAERIEGESLWPAAAQDGAFALPVFASGTCASGSRMLEVRAPSALSEAKASSQREHLAPPPPPSVLVSLPAAWARGASVSPTIARTAAGAGEITLLIDGRPSRSWLLAPVSPISPVSPAPSERAALVCEALDPAAVPPDARRVELRIARFPADLAAASSARVSAPASAILGLDSVDKAGPARAKND